MKTISLILASLFVFSCSSSNKVNKEIEQTKAEKVSDLVKTIKMAINDSDKLTEKDKKSFLIQLRQTLRNAMT